MRTCWGILALVLLVGMVSCHGRGNDNGNDNDNIKKDYWENGNLKSEQRYEDGKLDGLSRHWYENGNLMEESWYKAGVMDGEFTRWYDNGQVFQEGQYVDGMMDGSWMIFYGDGNLAAQASFDKGTGVQTSYEHSGYKCLVTNYVDNQKHGKETYYGPDGTVTCIAVYENGKWVRDDF